MKDLRILEHFLRYIISNCFFTKDTQDMILTSIRRVLIRHHSMRRTIVRRFIEKKWLFLVLIPRYLSSPVKFITNTWAWYQIISAIFPAPCSGKSQTITGNYTIWMRIKEYADLKIQGYNNPKTQGFEKFEGFHGDDNRRLRKRTSVCRENGLGERNRRIRGSKSKTSTTIIFTTKMFTFQMR